MNFLKAEKGRIFACRLDYEADLFDSIKKFSDEHKIAAGIFITIGAVRKAKISYYLQNEKKYADLSIDKHLEIASCLGSISKSKSETAIHAHITLSDDDGKTYGGHLVQGTIVFAGELFIVELQNIELERSYDDATGLNLLKM